MSTQQFRPNHAAAVILQAIEVRVRVSDDTRPWEDITPEYPTTNLIVGSLNEAYSAAYECATGNYSEFMEARWNWRGSCQGHYFKQFPDGRYQIEMRYPASDWYALSYEGNWHTANSAANTATRKFEEDRSIVDARVHDLVTDCIIFYITRQEATQS